MRHRPYDPHQDGPLFRTKRRRGNPQTVTVPQSGVGPHVKLVFAEMARQGRTYDQVEAASGIRRPTIKQWRRKNAPGLASIEAVMNCLGWHLIVVPAHIEPLPANVAAKVAEVAALARIEMSEVWTAALTVAASQFAATEEGQRILAEIDRDRATQCPVYAAKRRRRKPANDNTEQSADAA